MKRMQTSVKYPVFTQRLAFDLFGFKITFKCQGKRFLRKRLKNY